VAERYLVVDRLKFSYEGLFNVSEVYAVITNFFFDKGWDYYEKVNQELVTPSGKQFRFVIKPFKSVTDFYKIHILIKLNFFDVKEVEIEHKGQMVRMNQGLMRMMIDAHIQADRKEVWTDGGVKWFLQLIFQKYFFKQHFDQTKDWLESDVSDLYEKVRTYMNSYNYRYKNK